MDRAAVLAGPDGILFTTDAEGEMSSTAVTDTSANPPQKPK